MKIYTKTGDDGTTSLFGGGRVSKTHQRISAYGTVDETNAILGLVMASKPVKRIAEITGWLQNDLFKLGADLATPLTAKPFVDRISASDIALLETTIDDLETGLPELKNFILPGGTMAAAHLHQARTVCRRAERLASELALDSTVNDSCLHYLNRLSDLLFVMSRFENHEAGQAETPWKG